MKLNLTAMEKSLIKIFLLQSVFIMWIVKQLVSICYFRDVLTSNVLHLRLIKGRICISFQIMFETMEM